MKIINAERTSPKEYEYRSSTSRSLSYLEPDISLTRPKSTHKYVHTTAADSSSRRVSSIDEHIYVHIVLAEHTTEKSQSREIPCSVELSTSHIICLIVPVCPARNYDYFYTAVYHVCSALRCRSSSTEYLLYSVVVHVGHCCCMICSMICSIPPP